MKLRVPSSRVKWCCVVMFRSFFFLLLLSFFSSCPAADFYKGFWQFDVSVQVNGFIAKKKLKQISYCVRELNQLIQLFVPFPECEISSVVKSDNSLSWGLYCANEGGVYDGKAHFTRNKNLMRGDIRLDSLLQGVGSVMQTHYIIQGRFEPLCDVGDSLKH